MIRCTLEYWTDDGWYVGRIKEIPGVFSQGATIEELAENIRDAYELMLEDETASVPCVAAQRKELVFDL